MVLNNDTYRNSVLLGVKNFMFPAPPVPGPVGPAGPAGPLPPAPAPAPAPVNGASAQLNA